MDYFTNQQSQWPHLPVQTTSSHSSQTESGQQSAQNQQHPTIDPSAPYPYGDLSVSAATQHNPYWSSPSFFYPFPQSEYLPVTTYSSLNGATSTSNTQPQVAIDPSLTSPASQLQSADNAPNFPVFHQTTTHQEPILSINPSVLQNQPIIPPPRSIPVTPITSASRPKVLLRDVLKPLLTTSKLTGPSAVVVIVRLLESYDYPEIDCDDRTELFSKMSVQADDQFLKAWAESPSAMEITRTWLKAGASDKSDGPWRPSINPILSALNRMRFTIDSLKEAKIGKIIVKLTKDTNSATRDLSQDLESKWRRLLESAGSQTKSSESDDSKAKKRKTPDSANTKVIPPAKRPAISPVAPANLKPLVKREPKVIVTAIKDAKSDSSFFSNKPKAKLPKFTKAGPAPAKGGAISVKTENVSQPSSFDPFQEALRQMKRTASPKTEGRSGTPQAESKPTGQPSKVITVKKKKSVTFAPDSQLEQIKYIEKAVYEDDLSLDTMHGMHSLRDLDRSEGAALHAHGIFEEQMDWTDILLVESSAEDRGAQSTEKSAQEEREMSTLAAVYMFPSQIHESPLEPLQPIPDDPDIECKEMLLGEEIDGLVNGSSAANITDLLASLPSQAPGFAFTNQPTANFTAPTHLTGVDVSLLSSFIQSMQQQGNYNNLTQPFSTNGVDNSGWDPQYFQSGTSNQMQWDNSDAGWGGAGRGNGRGGTRGKRRPCKYFAQGHCRFGDSCDFSHDLTS